MVLRVSCAYYLGRLIPYEHRRIWIRYYFSCFRTYSQRQWCRWMDRIYKPLSPHLLCSYTIWTETLVVKNSPKSEKTMIADPHMATIIYTLISILAFLATYIISRKISGPKLTPVIFYTFIMAVIFIGVCQLSVARNGYMWLNMPLNYIFDYDETIRWIAFISHFFQVLCIPSRSRQKHWLLRNRR